MDNCENKVIARSLCWKHYLRWHRHGDPSASSSYVPKKGNELPQFKHGLWNHPLYGTWRAMMNRCYNPNDKRYATYGGRGISVCERWHDVGNFIADMSPRPEGLTLDRTDNNGNYELTNCRWVDMLTQARNRPQCKLTDAQRDNILLLCHDGVARSSVAKRLGIKYGDVKNIVYGHKRRTVDKGITTVMKALK